MARVLTGTADSTPTHGTDGWTGRIMVTGASITGTATCMARVYDGINNTGVLIATLSCTADLTDDHQFTEPIVCETGVYVDVITAGAGLRWYVYYK